MVSKSWLYSFAALKVFWELLLGAQCWLVTGASRCHHLEYQGFTICGNNQANNPAHCHCVSNPVASSVLFQSLSPIDRQTFSMLNRPLRAASLLNFCCSTSHVLCYWMYLFSFPAVVVFFTSATKKSAVCYYNTIFLWPHFPARPFFTSLIGDCLVQLLHQIKVFLLPILHSQHKCPRRFGFCWCYPFFIVLEVMAVLFRIYKLGSFSCCMDFILYLYIRAGLTEIKRCRWTIA